MVAIPKLDVAYFFVNKILNSSCHSKVFKLSYIYKDLLPFFKHGHKLSDNSQCFPLRLQGWTCCSLNLPQIKSVYLVQLVQLISLFTTFKGAGNVFLWLSLSLSLSHTHTHTHTHYTHQTFHSFCFKVLQIHWANDRRQWQLSDKILFLYYDNVLHSGDAKYMYLKIYIFWYVTACQVV